MENKMLNTIHESRVREGESNEALCFISDRYPKTEIAVQKAVWRSEKGNIKIWNIFYLSPRRALTLRSLSDQQTAEDLGRLFAHDCFNTGNPYTTALELQG